ncbi:MAG TPA: hypothetical protein VKA48_01730 [Gammaproteobacteria bacterium]|nr:hypothetical protein [Gammaproteobacteria bacterium]
MASEINGTGRWGRWLNRKTWKREYAAVVMLLWVAMVARVFFLTPPEDVHVYAALLTGLTVPMFGFVGAVAGLHIYQMKGGGNAGSGLPDG